MALPGVRLASGADAEAFPTNGAPTIVGFTAGGAGKIGSSSLIRTKTTVAVEAVLGGIRATRLFVAHLATIEALDTRHLTRRGQTCQQPVPHVNRF